MGPSLRRPTRTSHPFGNRSLQSGQRSEWAHHDVEFSYESVRCHSQIVNSVKHITSHFGTEYQRMPFLAACDNIGILEVLEERKDNLQNLGSGLFAYGRLIVDRG